MSVRCVIGYLFLTSDWLPFPNSISNQLSLTETLYQQPYIALFKLKTQLPTEKLCTYI